MKPIEIEWLARTFSKMICAEIGPENMPEVIRRNNTPEYQNACATHDFVDSNQIMIDAWEKLTHEKYTVENEEVYEASLIAHTHARKNIFFIK